MIFRLTSPFPNDTLWLQWIGGFAAMIMMFVVGLTIGWASPYLAQFSTEDSPFPASVDEVSWIASIFQLGRLPGAALGFIGNQYLGSKTTMIGNGCGLMLSWILVIAANSVAWLYVARFICGVAIEVASISFPLYLGDISSSNIRGALIAMTLNGLSLGILTGNIMGAYISMRIFACISLVPTISFVLIFILIPQSPYYLTSKSKMQDAEKSILKYNPKANISVEVETIKQFVATTSAVTFIDRLREFNIPRNRKAGLTVIILDLFAQFCGLNPIATYMETIVTRGMVTVVTPSIVPILANGLGIVAGLLMMYLADAVGRRRMWVYSSCGVCLAMTALGTHFYLLNDGLDPKHLQWIPIISMILFTICFNMGLNCIPAILLSELFGANIRTLAASISCAFAAVFAFTSVNSYQYLLELIDESYIYWMYAILMVVSAIFGLFLVPEMKGKTLKEIQDFMTEK
ncbi:facilitated trehalose transporter Tret1-like isoform X1 [Neodiprion pinetum]|uniref:facilitated trehalose transporter Tret1-like isoform X1 n=1 Tax=Neodiprion pinetum TaxID=441929 RepID=UPI001EDFAF0B|nr:facilitated trehalose transporter Tret1-like isoform X1 [Neodiprion pinetum]XP_046471584.1 facilitated trehalose transporter Tret1-like isoform X1 [Neodiprion pinetum]XP_046471585.1 facilitated trehalose transporter Tret1-like isoform X1 [Neodiprion pinetum]